MRSVALIANPVAGNRRRPLTPESAAALLRAHDLEVEVLIPGGPGEAMELAAAAARRHPVVVAAGGDGTVHEVATAVVASEAVLGVMPAGSGNDFAVGLGITSPAIGAAAVAADYRRAVDAASIDGRHFFNSAGFFLSGAVSGGAAGLWRWLGSGRYVVAAVRALATYRAQPACWRLDGEDRERDGRFLLAEVCNGSLTGGGFRLAPDADPTDGLLDLCLVRPMSAVTGLKLLPAAAAGRRIEHAAIERPRTTGLVLELPEPVPYHLDGEPGIWPAGTYRIEVSRGALSVAAPPPSSEQCS